MLIELAEATERGSEFQEILTLLLNTLIVDLLMHLSLRIFNRGPRLFVESVVNTNYLSISMRLFSILKAGIRSALNLRWDKFIKLRKHNLVS